PRYSCVMPRWRPCPTASITVTPTCPVDSSTASITVSIRSRITAASTFTICGLPRLGSTKKSPARTDSAYEASLPRSSRRGWRPPWRRYYTSLRLHVHAAHVARARLHEPGHAARRERDPDREPEQHDAEHEDEVLAARQNLLDEDQRRDDHHP